MNPVCILCGSKNIISILDKPASSIWTNAPDDMVRREVFPCRMHQCCACGHVFELISEHLAETLRTVYQSSHAQASATLGEGNWGKERARRFFEIIDSDLAGYRSVLEIGCAQGYVLRALREKGFRRLVGIDPSLPKTDEIDGISFVKTFVDDTLKIEERFDVLLAFSVLEHVIDLNSFLRFCSRHLADDGIFVFIVPDADSLLAIGDLGLFLHEHIHYFTRASLNWLLRQHGLTIRSIQLRDGGYMVIVEHASGAEAVVQPVLYTNYQDKIDRILTRTRSIFEGGSRLLVHGATNTLYNILGWLGGRHYDFTLVDNDTQKHGEYFSGYKVNVLDRIDLSQYDALLIITTPFFKDIREDYIRRGFKGIIAGTSESPYDVV